MVDQDTYIKTELAVIANLLTNEVVKYIRSELKFGNLIAEDDGIATGSVNS